MRVPFYLTRMRGRQVPVLYDPQDPHKACIDSPSGRGQVRSGYGTIALGTFFLLVAAEGGTTCGAALQVCAT
jgi:hypothetical protein